MATNPKCLFLDIDNTLYSANTNISKAMGTRIANYFVNLGLEKSEASKLHLEYYTKYGLALRGLVAHHGIDPLDFDRKCDQSLPLEEMLSPDPELRQLLQDIDRTKTRVFALTNAYKPHAERVLHLLNLADQIEGGLIYCDYEVPDFPCKPEPEYYHKALRTAGNPNPGDCYFVDDSRINVVAAKNLGWGHVVHFKEVGLEVMEGGQLKQLVDSEEDETSHDYIPTIADLQKLRVLWPEIFKDTT
ncbi:pyrimidine 5-nucleotidase [Flagelloscypha sp. PMI_526]|nr:pyrimidine 5-nucleotidase [Flagelloscypha sp. PMI_526]